MPSKKKASASAHAQDRAQRENHLSEAPAITRRNKAADQERAVPESPLTGEDRPGGRAGGKQQEHDPAKTQRRVHRTADSNMRPRGGQIVPEGDTRLQ